MKYDGRSVVVDEFVVVKLLFAYLKYSTKNSNKLVYYIIIIEYDRR